MNSKMAERVAGGREERGEKPWDVSTVKIKVADGEVGAAFCDVQEAPIGRPFAVRLPECAGVYL
jgi:hypothetical protein